MKSINEIRNDLRQIKYYYSRKKKLDVGFGNTGVNEVITLASEYNNLIKNAPPRLYDVYVELYLNNQTQDSLADEFGVSQSYIYQKNKQLLEFFETALKSNEIKNN